MSSAKLATAISEEDHTQGPADAAITLVQYGDYECPYTRLSRHSVHQLQREFPDSLRFVFRHFPLEEIHPRARAAAKTVYAPASERVPKPPLPADEKLIDQGKDDVP